MLIPSYLNLIIKLIIRFFRILKTILQTTQNKNVGKSFLHFLILR